MPGPFRPIVNFVRRRRPKPADYSLLHVDPGLHPQEDRHDEQGSGCGFVQGSSGLLLGTQRVLDVDHLPPPGSMLDDGRGGVEEVVRGTNQAQSQAGSQDPIPVWPAEDDSERLTVQSEAPRIPPMAGPPPRPPKSPQRLTMANPASSSSSGVMPVPALVDNQTLVRRLSHLDLSLMPLEQHNNPSNVRVGERWDPGTPLSFLFFELSCINRSGLDTTELFTPLSATVETPYTNLFDTPLSLASTLTDHECNSPPPREIISHDKDSGEAGVVKEPWTSPSSEQSERGALFLRDLEESVVVPVTRLLLSPVGDLIPLVNDPIDVDPHEDARVGILGLDEVGWNPDATFERPIPRNRGSYPSIPSIASFPSIPSLPSTSSLASIPSTPHPHQSMPPPGLTPRAEASQHNTISFPRLPDMKVPDKPGWILHIPIEERKAWAGGKVRILQAALPILRGDATMEDWDRLLEAFDADPYNWIAKPSIMAFRRVSELELDLKLEYEATPINWVLSILYEIHSWIRGDTETAQEMCSSLEVAFTRVGWAKGCLL
ncbi:hypothetical protein FA13DRAFT_1741733, partial [Coprinellus micaceus]